MNQSPANIRARVDMARIVDNNVNESGEGSQTKLGSRKTENIVLIAKNGRDQQFLQYSMLQAEKPSLAKEAESDPMQKAGATLRVRTTKMLQ